MKKRVVLSILEDNPGLAQALGRDISRMGLDVVGHVWVDDLQNHAWAQAGQELAHPETRLWIVAGGTGRFADKTTRQGLALAMLQAQAEHGHGFSVLLSPSGGDIDTATLPTPLLGADCATRNIPAKAAVLTSKPLQKLAGEYRIMPHALPGLGLWFEIGPRATPWQGAFLAAAGGSPDVQGVGPAGSIPSKTTLHYPVKGMRLSLGEREYEGNGVHNEISPANSYYARLGGAPEAIVFGAFPDSDEAELFSLNLC